ncbi:MAG: hypothetical protein ACM34I_07255 [bacterium]
MEKNVADSMIEQRDPLVSEIMAEYAGLTGLSPAGPSPRRYLWTDAFAVCNLLELYRQTSNEHYRHLASLLVDQVHAVLGRHRADDPRSGWISGLDELEGARHPTIGGLRIGKEMNERRPEDPFDEQLEWDRDGQYYHYLTQWMHALNRMSQFTREPTYNTWAIELAKTAHARFAQTPKGGGQKRIYWKMSIDLSYPLVTSMGQHDPLDGLITYSELQATARKYQGLSAEADLSAEIDDISRMCTGKSLITDDPLGLGGLLTGAYRIVQLVITGNFARFDLVEDVVASSLTGLASYVREPHLKLPAGHRLAFREFGLSIGLKAVEKLNGLLEQYPGVVEKCRFAQSHLESLMQYVPLREVINAFWLERRNRESAPWLAHRAINMVMLATSLKPDGYISLQL